MIVSSVAEQALIHYYVFLACIFNLDSPDGLKSKWTEHEHLKHLYKEDSVS